MAGATRGFAGGLYTCIYFLGLPSQSSVDWSWAGGGGGGLKQQECSISQSGGQTSQGIGRATSPRGSRGESAPSSSPGFCRPRGMGGPSPPSVFPHFASVHACLCVRFPLSRRTHVLAGSPPSPTLTLSSLLKLFLKGRSCAWVLGG